MTGCKYRVKWAFVTGVGNRPWRSHLAGCFPPSDGTRKDGDGTEQETVSGLAQEKRTEIRFSVAWGN